MAQGCPWQTVGREVSSNWLEGYPVSGIGWEWHKKSILHLDVVNESV